MHNPSPRADSAPPAYALGFATCWTARARLEAERGGVVQKRRQSQPINAPPELLLAHWGLARNTDDGWFVMHGKATERVMKHTPGTFE